MGQLHQHRHPAGIVVGADERAPRILLVFHRKRQRVVVGAQEDAVGARRAPVDQDVRHRHRRTVLRMGHAKALELHLPAQLLEMLRQQLLLGFHAGRAAGRGPIAQSCLRTHTPGPRRRGCRPTSPANRSRRRGRCGPGIPQKARQQPCRRRQHAGQHEHRRPKQRPGNRTRLGGVSLS